MDLWIRSQDGWRLKLVTELRTYHSDGSKYYMIEGGTSGTDKYNILGIYKTKEKVIEVLDNIHELLMPTLIYKSNVDKDETIGIANISNNVSNTINHGMDIKVEQSQTIVFQMPEDD